MKRPNKTGAAWAWGCAAAAAFGLLVLFVILAVVLQNPWFYVGDLVVIIVSWMVSANARDRSTQEVS